MKEKTMPSSSSIQTITRPAYIPADRDLAQWRADREVGAAQFAIDANECNADYGMRTADYIAAHGSLPDDCLPRAISATDAYDIETRLGATFDEIVARATLAEIDAIATQYPAAALEFLLLRMTVGRAKESAERCPYDAILVAPYLLCIKP